MSAKFLSVLLCLACCGCVTHPHPQDLLCKQLVLPNLKQSSWIVLGRDTVINVRNIPKIVSYYNAHGCVSCRLKDLRGWNTKIRELRTMYSDSINVEFMFIMRANRKDSIFMRELRNTGFRYPVLLDENGIFEKENSLPLNSDYHTFLLDSNNYVILIGTPLYSKKFWNRYKYKISECSSLLP